MKVLWCILVCRRWQGGCCVLVIYSIESVIAMTKAIVNMMPILLPNVQYLDLAIGLDSDGIRYSHLLKLFIHLQDRLAEVQIALETLRSSLLEGVLMCSFHKPYYAVPQYSSVALTSAASSLLSTLSTLITASRDSKDTIFRLDLSHTPFSDHSQGIQHFEYLQKFRRLQVLYIVAGHVRILDRIHKDNASAKNTYINVPGDNNSGSCQQRQPTRHDLSVTELCFLSVTDPTFVTTTIGLGLI